MSVPSMEDIKRAAAGEGAEPLYTQAFWRASVQYLLALPGNCTWAQEGDEKSDTYATSCGRYFSMLDGTPVEGGFKHCCYCGGRLVQVLIEAEVDIPL